MRSQVGAPSSNVSDHPFHLGVLMNEMEGPLAVVDAMAEAAETRGDWCGMFGHRRDALFYVLMISGCLRQSEVVALRRCDLTRGADVDEIKVYVS